jgi:hypothetical protein
VPPQELHASGANVAAEISLLRRFLHANQTYRFTPQAQAHLLSAIELHKLNKT